MTTRILLVEDDPVSRDLLAALLAARGYTVDTADDGFGALSMAQDERYDLVFVDYHLPEMDGYALARLLRTLGEKTNADMKMVAITADRFGLAARRGVDSIFDKMLTKPIDPDALYAFVDEFLGAATLSDLDTFLVDPLVEDARGAADVLWRARGLNALPTAAVFPAPTAAERASLEYCFRLVEADAADCFILLREAGFAGIEEARASGRAYLQPLFCLDGAHAAMSDVWFKVGNADSWTAAATALSTFAARRAKLDAGITETEDGDLRLVAYLRVSERALVLRRDPAGRTIVPYTGGFAVSSVFGAVKRLATNGFVTAKPGESAEGRELVVSLTQKGIARVASRDAMRLPVAG